MIVIYVGGNVYIASVGNEKVVDNRPFELFCVQRLTFTSNQSFSTIYPSGGYVLITTFVEFCGLQVEWREVMRGRRRLACV